MSDSPANLVDLELYRQAKQFKQANPPINLNKIVCVYWQLVDLINSHTRDGRACQCQTCVVLEELIFKSMEIPEMKEWCSDEHQSTLYLDDSY